ncbi:MAG TPA: metal-dependent hydrolase, partial [Thermomicrobiaceae bacterium]|nr:metal-dependent hydrolase [Thermomicrobiaceae bacterium]
VARLALALGVLLADRILAARRPPPVLAALLDEPAHLASSALLLPLPLPLPGAAPARRWYALGAAAGSVLIDLDHLPRYLHPTPARPLHRPATHSALSVAALLALALALPERRRLRPFTLGAAAGLAGHLARDAATGGVPLGWPLRSGTVTIARAGYTLLLLRGALGRR